MEMTLENICEVCWEYVGEMIPAEWDEGYNGYCCEDCSAELDENE